MKGKKVASVLKAPSPSTFCIAFNHIISLMLTRTNNNSDETSENKNNKSSNN
jgi:hypothetical protein